jgi:hypothetical protein
MSRLAEGRAEYANLVASVENHTRIVEIARKNLADARARQAGARSASVISRIDAVEAGIRPIGPARKTITAAGGLGGLLFGFGLVFLFANPAAQRSAIRSSVNGSVNSTVAKLSRNPNESFGMFRGMTLEEAIRSMRQHGAVH